MCALVSAKRMTMIDKIAQENFVQKFYKTNWLVIIIKWFFSLNNDVKRSLSFLFANPTFRFFFDFLYFHRFNRPVQVQVWIPPLMIVHTFFSGSNKSICKVWSITRGSFWVSIFNDHFIVLLKKWIAFAYWTKPEYVLSFLKSILESYAVKVIPFATFIAC